MLQENGVSINFDAHGSHGVLVNGLLREEELSTFEEFLKPGRRGNYLGFDTYLSFTVLDHTFLTHEDTKLELWDYTHPSNTWRGWISIPGSKIFHGREDSDTHPYSRQRAEKVRELLFQRGYRSQIIEAQRKSSPLVVKRNNHIFELLSDMFKDSPEDIRQSVMKNFSQTIDPTTPYWNFVIPTSDESGFIITLAYPAKHNIETSVKYEPVIQWPDPTKLTTYVSEDGKKMYLYPLYYPGYIIGGGGAEDSRMSKDTTNAQSFSIESAETFTRMVRSYGALYKAFLESLYEERGISPSVNINFQINYVRGFV